MAASSKGQRKIIQNVKIYGVTENDSENLPIPLTEDGTAVKTNDIKTLTSIESCLQSILKELKIMNLHNSFITDEVIESEMVEV
jgi:hypothetical protein